MGGKYMYYDNEIITMSKKELHALIADAVKEGVRAALKESGGRGLYPDSERPDSLGFEEPHLKKTPDGETGNAKSYLGVVRKQLDVYCDYLSVRQVIDIMSTMMSILNIDEVKYVLSHLDEGYEPSNRHEFSSNSAALLQRFAANQQKK
jgi:hypothetical protein